MIAAATTLAQVLCCIGLGAALMSALRLSISGNPVLHWSVAFTVGHGILGWLLFIIGMAGLFTPGPVAVLLAAGVALFILTWRTAPRVGLAVPQADAVTLILLALLAVVVFLDAMEALAPAADADSLAYHFDLPKQFIGAGRIFFIGVPLEGAVPLLTHIGYVPVLMLGGEESLTLWTMISGWSAAAVLYGVCRIHTGAAMALVAALLFLTTPAVVYGAGSGQVEARIAGFAMVAAWSTAEAIRTGNLRYAVLGGMGAGFFMASKYTGALFCAAAGAMIMMQKRWLAMGLVFGISGLAAGAQWYGWNWLHTGDPFFPVLFDWIGRENLDFWSKDYNAYFKDVYFAAENPLAKTVINFLLLPVYATFNLMNMVDAGRVGLGPFPLLAAPFAVVAAVRLRRRIAASPLFIYLLIAGLFYAVWFVIGGSMRVRHLVPVLPILLVVLCVAAARISDVRPYRLVFALAVAATLALQTAGHAVFARQYITAALTGESKDAFLYHNLRGYNAIRWVNENLDRNDKVLVFIRELRFYMQVPSFFAGIVQAQVGLDPERNDPETLYRELRTAGVTHAILNRPADGPGVDVNAPYQPPINILLGTGCLQLLHRAEGPAITSRTLGTVEQQEYFDIYALRDETCLQGGVQ